jgi:GDSL-like lipase/acylhydrolase family protein
MAGRVVLRVLASAGLAAAAATFGLMEHRATMPRARPFPTTSTTASPTPPDPRAIVVVGDSLSVQAGGPERVALDAAGWRTVRFDTQIGRRIATRSAAPSSSGIAAVRALRATGGDALTWVIELGTNDVSEIGDDARALGRSIDAMLDEIGPGHRVVWVNVYHHWRSAAAATFNRVLADAASRHPGMVVADWASHAPRDDYLLPDGVHLTASGSVAYASIIVDAVQNAPQALLDAGLESVDDRSAVPLR